MNTQTITVQNLKCGGCANTIRKNLEAFESISDVEINVENSQIDFQLDHPEKLEEVVHSLSKLGYPVVDEKNGLQHKVKSYVSCMVGRMSSQD